MKDTQVCIWYIDFVCDGDGGVGGDCDEDYDDINDGGGDANDGDASDDDDDSEANDSYIGDGDANDDDASGDDDGDVNDGEAMMPMMMVMSNDDNIKGDICVDNDNVYKANGHKSMVMLKYGI